jgi:predicted DNA-binding protein YlxM (UPF0122 family)
VAAHSLRSQVTLDELTELCERFYERDGFVKWAEVADAFGITRQAVQARLKQAVTRGRLSAETVERWQSMSARAAHTRHKEAERKFNRSLVVEIQLSPENSKWLRTECAVRSLRSSDIINGLINKARNS